jgi:hypothetical protein
MNGDINLRNDDIYDKLDSSPKEDIKKLIDLEKTLNKNNVGNIIRNSFSAMEDNIFKLDGLYQDYSDFSIPTDKKSKRKEEKQDNLFEKLSDNLDNKDNFIMYIEQLYKLLFIPYSKELIVKNKLGYTIYNNNTDEYVNNRVLGRILYNIHYFRNYSKNYIKGEFNSIISKIKDSLTNYNYINSTDYKAIDDFVKKLYDNNINTETLNLEIAQHIFKADAKQKIKIDAINDSIEDSTKNYSTQYTIDTVFIKLIKKIQTEINNELTDNGIDKSNTSPEKLISLARIKRQYNKDLDAGTLVARTGTAATSVGKVAGLIEIAIRPTVVDNTSANDVVTYANNVETNGTTEIQFPQATGTENSLLAFIKNVLLVPSDSAISVKNATAAARAKEETDATNAANTTVGPQAIYENKNNVAIIILKVLKNNGISLKTIEKSIRDIIANKTMETALLNNTVIDQLLIETIYQLYLKIDEDVGIIEVKQREGGALPVTDLKIKQEITTAVKNVISRLMDPIHIGTTELINNVKIREIIEDNNPTEKKVKSLELIAYIAAYNIVKYPPSSFEKTNKDLLLAKIVYNMKLLLNKEDDDKEYIVKTLCLHLYISKEFESKGIFFALEVYYGIIYGSTLRYDLKMLKENEYIIERLVHLDKTFELIKGIVADDTFRTLKNLYIKKYPGKLNIFRIDTTELIIIKPVDNTNKTITTGKEDFKSYDEYRLRDLVILDIENGGVVDIKKFKQKLDFIYSKNEYENIFNICSLTTQCILLAEQIKECKIALLTQYCNEISDAFEITYNKLIKEINAFQVSKDQKPASLKIDKLTKIKEILEEIQTKIKEKTKEDAELPSIEINDEIPVPTISAPASNSGAGSLNVNVPFVSIISNLFQSTTQVKRKKVTVKGIDETKIKSIITEINTKNGDLKKNLDEIINATREDIKKETNGNSEIDRVDGAQTDDQDAPASKKEESKPTKTTDDTKNLLLEQLRQILLPDDIVSNTMIDLFNEYKKQKKITVGGDIFEDNSAGYNNRVISAPVTNLREDCFVLPITFKSRAEIEEDKLKEAKQKQKGGDYGDSDEVAKKRDELKEALENINFEDDTTETVGNNAKRQFNELKANIKEFINKPINIEKDDTKLLDDEYIDVLKKFNINEIKTNSYEELRKNLYRIKNSEYFEDIKITNEDIYTFIATTYILRVISLYIVLWFIQIEIIKDVESVIVTYILTYILLFILIYTFVNLSDNKLDTPKSYLYYFYSRVNFSYTRFIVHLGLLFLLIIIPFIIRTVDKESSTYKNITDTEKRYLYTFITNMSTIVWVVLSIIAFFFK